MLFSVCVTTFAASRLVFALCSLVKQKFDLPFCLSAYCRLPYYLIPIFTVGDLLVQIRS